ncbi:MAG TPA: hypothetical protein VN779_25240 [Actinocrinis sp.]|jgi:hypothetical protein|nr:hypothetical protein [Actinocrinis sp.]
MITVYELLFVRSVGRAAAGSPEIPARAIGESANAEWQWQLRTASQTALCYRSRCAILTLKMQNRRQKRLRYAVTEPCCERVFTLTTRPSSTEKDFAAFIIEGATTHHHER